MKTPFPKLPAVVLALTALLFFVASCKPKPPNLAGNWQYNGQACQIIQHGDDLTFINERGEQSEGRFNNKTQVIATDWENGLIGTLADGGNRINWRNNTVWTRAK